MTLGISLRYLRQSAGLTQSDLAERLGISASYLSQIETDKREASVPLLRRLAAELGAPAVLLIASALAGSPEKPASADLAAVLEKLVRAVGLNHLQENLALTPGEHSPAD